MATLHAAADGTILQFKRTPTEESRYLAPPEAVFTLQFDSHTNPELLQDLYEALSLYTLVDAVLARGGVPQTIAPPCQTCLDAGQVPELLSKLEAGDPLLATELQTALRVLLRERGT